MSDDKLYSKRSVDKTHNKEYNLFTSTDEFASKVTPRDKQTFSRSLANKTMVLADGEVKTIHIYCPDNIYTFVANGYMQGYIADFDNVDFIEKTKRSFEKYYGKGINEDTENTGLWFEPVFNQSRRQAHNVSVSSRGGRSAADNLLFKNSSNSYGTRDYERLWGYTHTKE